MKIFKLILLSLPLCCFLTAHAQKQSCPAANFAPQKGDFTLALTLGYNNYASVKALPGNLTNYEAAALSTDWTEKKLMVGFEAGWFFKDLWKLNLSGGLNFTNNPGYAGVPGTLDDESTPGDGSIPNYLAVADAYSLGYTLSTGVDRYFKLSSVPRLRWYMGGRIGMAYALNEQKYDDPDRMGKSSAESWNLRFSYTMGVDYYVLPALYIGAQIDPFSYTYNMTSYKPQEGLSNLDADSHHLGVLAAPTLKIGFKFGKSNRCTCPKR